MGKSSGGKHGGGAGRSDRAGRTAMTPQAASRIQSAGDKDRDSRTAQTGFGPRAQSAAARGSTGKPSGRDG